MARWSLGIPEPPQFLEFDEVMRIIGYVASNSHHARRDVLVLTTLWESGGRISEVLSLTPEGIGINSLILPNLKQEKKKKKALQNGRPMPHKETIVTPELCAELKEFSYNIPESTPIFRGNRDTGKRLGYRYMYRLIKRAGTDLNILKMKKGKLKPYMFTGAWPHLFRHASAMHILDETGDLKLVQRQLGHSSIVTSQMYAQIRPEQAGKSLSEVHWKNNKRKKGG